MLFTLHLKNERLLLLHLAEIVLNVFSLLQQSTLSKHFAKYILIIWVRTMIILI